jgi:hypothetical protein
VKQKMKKILICLFALVPFFVLATACMRIAHNTVIMQQEEKTPEKSPP